MSVRLWLPRHAVHSRREGRRCALCQGLEVMIPVSEAAPWEGVLLCRWGTRWRSSCLEVESISSYGGTDLRSQHNTEGQKHAVAGNCRMCDSSSGHARLTMCILRGSGSIHLPA